MADDLDSSLPPIRELSRAQRRVLGVLVEKGITTPDAYPLTLKAVTTGCNQKSNRDPISNYDEDRVEAVLEELRELGLVGVVHTESGRTQRFRHYVRKRFTLTEPQIAILTELLLRGQQSTGELRTRASRMVSIESLEQLRTELENLMSQKLVRADAPLDRRGVEVDHNLYPANENQPMRARVQESYDTPPTTTHQPSPTRAPAPSVGPDVTGRLSQLESVCEELRSDNSNLKSELSELRSKLEEVSDMLADLRRQLGA